VRIKCWLTAFATFTIGTLLSSPALVAQPSPPAPAADGGGAQVAPAQVYGKILSNMEAEILGAAEAMPAEKYNFAPTNGNFQGVRTFGEQVKHIASSNSEFFGDFGVTPGPDSKAIDKLTTKDDIIKALKDSNAFAHRAVDTITAQNAFEEFGAHKSTRAGLATRAMAHANDHYGQMVEYLRMNGIVPPASR
jgi:uncharacterized damage-inducible protein DinB